MQSEGIAEVVVMVEDIVETVDVSFLMIIFGFNFYSGAVVTLYIGGGGLEGSSAYSISTHWSQCDPYDSYSRAACQFFFQLSKTGSIT
jgi:hypothetical protein